LGTVNQDSGDRFFAVAAEAFAALAGSVQGIFVMPPGTVVDRPPNVLAAPRVPQLELLAQLHAVVFHGGHNTMCEALAHGLPLVVAPIRDDQPANASQITDAHAGVRVKFGRVSAEELREAILVVLDDPSYAAGARASGPRSRRPAARKQPRIGWRGCCDRGYRRAHREGPGLVRRGHARRRSGGIPGAASHHLPVVWLAGAANSLARPGSDSA